MKFFKRMSQSIKGKLKQASRYVSENKALVGGIGVALALAAATTAAVAFAAPAVAGLIVAGLVMGALWTAQARRRSGAKSPYDLPSLLVGATIGAATFGLSAGALVGVAATGATGAVGGAALLGAPTVVGSTGITAIAQQAQNDVELETAQARPQFEHGAATGDDPLTYEPFSDARPEAPQSNAPPAANSAETPRVGLSTRLSQTYED